MEYVQTRENTPGTPRPMSADISTGIVRNVSLGAIIIITKMEPFVKIPLCRGTCEKFSRSKEGMSFSLLLVCPIAEKNLF